MIIRNLKNTSKQACVKCYYYHTFHAHNGPPTPHPTLTPTHYTKLTSSKICLQTALIWSSDVVPLSPPFTVMFSKPGLKNIWKDNGMMWQPTDNSGNYQNDPCNQPLVMSLDALLLLCSTRITFRWYWGAFKKSGLFNFPHLVISQMKQKHGTTRCNYPMAISITCKSVLRIITNDFQRFSQGFYCIIGPHSHRHNTDWLPRGLCSVLTST